MILFFCLFRKEFLIDSKVFFLYVHRSYFKKKIKNENCGLFAIVLKSIWVKEMNYPFVNAVIVVTFTSFHVFDDNIQRHYLFLSL